MLIEYLRKEKRAVAGKSVFWASEIADCPRKVLLRRSPEVEFVEPELEEQVKMGLGFAAEALLKEAGERIQKTNTKTVLEAVGERPGLFSQLQAALRDGRTSLREATDWCLPQFGAVKRVGEVELRLRTDALVLIEDRLYVLEVKLAGPGLTQALRKDRYDLPPGFLTQIAAYAWALDLPGILVVASTTGQVWEYEFLVHSGLLFVDGTCFSLAVDPGRVEAVDFIEKRLAFLSRASVEDFPIIENGGILRPKLPEGFPTHRDDRYQLVIGKKGAQRTRRRKGEEERSFRCYTCPARRICYPGLLG